MSCKWESVSLKEYFETYRPFQRVCSLVDVVDVEEYFSMSLAFSQGIP
jgi:hypothetical protein